MSKPILIVFPEMLKSHVDSYTRSDGTVVQAHDDKRVAAAPKFKGSAVAKKHEDIMVHKAPAWDHDGYDGKKVPASDVAGAPEFSHKDVYGHNDNTSPAGDDFSKKFAAKGHTHFVIKHPNGKRSLVNTEGNDYALYHAPIEEGSASDKPAAKRASPKKAAPAAAAAPETKSNNEDFGFHGEAAKQHLYDKHGPDNYYSHSTEQDHADAKAVGAKKFSAAAHHLVQAGHFEKHEHARDYLDSTSGRHLHDAAPDGNIGHVPWLGKDVARFKKNTGLQKSMLMVRPDLLK